MHMCMMHICHLGMHSSREKLHQLHLVIFSSLQKACVGVAEQGFVEYERSEDRSSHSKAFFHVKLKVMLLLFLLMLMLMLLMK